MDTKSRQEFVKSLNPEEQSEFYTLLLQELWNSSRSQGNSGWGQTSSYVSVEACKSQLKENSYVDYFNGKVIKVLFHENGLDNYLYDRDIGFGAFNRVFEQVKSSFTTQTA